MKPTKIQYTERMFADKYSQEFLDRIMGQCWNLIWGKVKEQGKPIFTHSKKACEVCTHKYRCFTVRHKE
jgi:hypothetical protein